MVGSGGGRRERKKAATRQAIGDAALRLFLERGYDKVSVRAIADEADVSTATLFAHFPGKEAMVFDDDSSRQEQLVATVRDRPEGVSIPAALERYFASMVREVADDTRLEPFHRLVAQTPELHAYWVSMWARHERALACAIAEAQQAAEPDVRMLAFARFVLQLPSLVAEQADPEDAVHEIFALLDQGWGAT